MSVAAQCPSCGAPIAFHVASSIVTVCDSCGTLVARTDRTLQQIGRTSDLVQTQSPLTLWMGGRYHGVGFQLTGRAQLRHGLGGVWDEWYMALDDGRWAWLAEAQGRFYVTFPQPAEVGAGMSWSGALAPGQSVSVGGHSLVVAEVGEAEMLAARGEIPYAPSLGRRYNYADLSGASGEFGTIDFGEQPPRVYLGYQVSLDDLGISAQAPAQQHGHGPGEIAAAEVAVTGVTCSNCGGSLELHAPDRTERVACPYCGTMHACDHGVLSLLKVASEPPVKPGLALGSRGRFEDGAFTVIGYMERATQVGWEVYSWDEYLLYHPRLGFRWLVNNDGHWNYVAPVAVGAVSATTSPRDSHTRGETAEYDGKEFQIFQFGPAEVTKVVGEFYWKVEAGQVTHTADYIAPPLMLSGDASDREINWSLGTYMTRKELAARFPGVQLPDARPKGVAPNQPFRHSGVYRTWGVLAALSVLMLVWAIAASDSRVVTKQNFPIPAQSGGVKDSKVFFSEPFELAGGQNIEIDASDIRVDNSWLYVEVDLYNDITGQVFAIALPIEYYHGVSDGESWSEGDREESRALSAVPAGTYLMRVAVERPDRRRASDLRITVRQDIVRFGEWMIAFILIALLPIGVFIKHRMMEGKRWSNSSFSDEDDD